MLEYLEQKHDIWAERLNVTSVLDDLFTNGAITSMQLKSLRELPPGQVQTISLLQIMSSRSAEQLDAFLQTIEESDQKELLEGLPSFGKQLCQY